MTAAAAPPRGPGRPSTGVRVDIRIPADLLEAIDAEAAVHGWTRAEMIRTLMAAAIVRYVPPKKA